MSVMNSKNPLASYHLRHAGDGTPAGATRYLVPRNLWPRYRESLGRVVKRGGYEFVVTRIDRDARMVDLCPRRIWGLDSRQ